MSKASRYFPIVSCVVLTLLPGTGDLFAEPAPTAYRIEDLGTLGAPDECEYGLWPTWANAFGLNESGHVVGHAERSEWLVDPDSGEPLVYPDSGQAVCRRWGQAVLWRDGEAIPLGSLSDNTLSFAFGVNNHDEVVGWAMQANSSGSGYHGQPFLWAEGEGMIDAAPGFRGGTTWGINDFGELAMILFRGVDPGGAYLRDRNGAPRKIMVDDPVGLGESDTAWEINDDGIVVGSVRRLGAAGARHAFRYETMASTVEDIHDPFFLESEAYGLNENGDAVGWTYGYMLRTFGFVSSIHGDLVVLPLGNMVIDGELRWDLMASNAEHMNDRGDVVGADGAAFTDPVPWVVFEALGKGPLEKIPLWELLGPEDREQWEPLRAFEINEARQIVGTGLHDGRIRAFLMTPGDTASVADAQESDPEPVATRNGAVDARPDRVASNAGVVPASLAPNRKIGSSLSLSPIDPSEARPGVDPVSAIGRDERMFGITLPEQRPRQAMPPAVGSVRDPEPVGRSGTRPEDSPSRERTDRTTDPKQRNDG